MVDDVVSMAQPQFSLRQKHQSKAKPTKKMIYHWRQYKFCMDPTHIADPLMIISI